ICFIKEWLKDRLDDLDSKEFKYFHWYLHTSDKSEVDFPRIKKSRLEHADRLDTVDLMFQKEVTKKILKKIESNKGLFDGAKNLKHQKKFLLNIYSGSQQTKLYLKLKSRLIHLLQVKVQLAWCKHVEVIREGGNPSKPHQSKHGHLSNILFPDILTRNLFLNCQVFKVWLLDILEDLDKKELKLFQWYLQNADESKDGFKPITKSKLYGADRLETVDLMIKTYTPKTREVTKKILKKIESNKGMFDGAKISFKSLF
uniref:Pyrin domain-containing protein n=1 Tax=Poecilia latipinna TaxID=48699 RepID=A0A3B3TMZ8_9TELE